MNSTTVDGLLLATVAVLVVCILVWLRRPDLRSRSLLRGGLVVSALALVLQIGFLLAFMSVLENMGNMSEF